VWWPERFSVLAPASLNVGLSPGGVHVVDAQSARQWHVACAAAGTPASTTVWRDAVDALVPCLAEAAEGKKRNVRVHLGGRLVRWQLLPWRPELHSHSEHAAFAAARFREVFGSAAEGWQLHAAKVPPGQATPAAAIDKELLAALQSGIAAAAPAVQLQSVAPYFSAAFDRWRHRLPRAACWFVTVEDDCISYGLLLHRQWQCLHSQRRQGDWRQQLPLWLTQAALAIDAAPRDPLALPICIAGDMPNPPAAVPGAAWNFQWLARRPVRGLTAQSGQRLALGV